MADKARTAVLISGRGSNLAALVAAARDPYYPARITLVAADNPHAGGLAFARDNAIATAIVERERFGSRADFEAELDAGLRAAGIELVCLAGFMRILSRDFVERWRDRMLNIHPSLLPLFPGLDTHARALEAGVRLHGATVHFVRPKMDSGPIIVQGAVPVLPADTADTLAARVLKLEHRLYPLALRLVAGGQARVDGERVRIAGREGDADAALLSPPEKD
jgi:phosphoribosylglycinamide formyltransferase-1